MDGIEAPIYQAGNVSVSRTLVRVANKSYPVNGIGSVFIKKQNTIGMFIVGLLVLFVGWVLRSTDDSTASVVCLVLGALATLSALFPNRILIFHTAAGETAAVTSRDLKYLRGIQTAVEQAVVERG